MNSLRLEIYESKDGNALKVEGLMFIDGKQVCQHDGYCLNWMGLTQAVLCDGKFYPITCSCSDPGCAGIWKAVQVSRAGGLLHWTMLEPYALGNLTFDREQVITHTLETLLWARQKIAPLQDIDPHYFPLLPATMDDAKVHWCISSLRAGELLPPPWG